MATKNLNLGIVPVSRGEFDSTTIYYKDNIVQYKRGSYQVISESPIVGVPPINDEDIVNNGWIIFAGTPSKASLIKSNTQDLSGNNVQENLNSAAEKLKKLELEVVYDVSSHNNGAVFDSLSALLSSSNLSTLIPTSVRHGGMTIRFIQVSEQSSDNKYVQYTYNLQYTNTTSGNANFINPANWYSIPDKINTVVQVEGVKPSFELDGTSIVVKFKNAGYFNVFDGDGWEKNFRIDANSTYTIASNNILLWNLSNNTVSVVSKSTVKPFNSIILLNNREGYANQGALSAYFVEWVAANYAEKLVNGFVQVEGVVPPTFSKNGQTIEVSFGANTYLHYTGGDGTNVKVTSVSNLSFSISTNEVLIWDMSTNEVSVVAKNASRRTDSVLLLNNRQGYATRGELVNFACLYTFNIDDVIKNNINNVSFQVEKLIPSFSIVASDGGNITVTFASKGYTSGCCIKAGNFKGNEYVKNIEPGTSYTILSNHDLIWDLDQNEISSVKFNAVKPRNSLILLNNRENIANQGLLLSWYLKSIEVGYVQLEMNVPPTFIQNGETIIISFGTNAILYEIDKFGNNAKSVSVSEQSFEIPTNSILAWNLLTNTVSVLAKNAARDENTIILLNNRQGYATQGYLSAFYTEWHAIQKSTANLAKLDTMETRYSKIPLSTLERGQSVVVIGNNILEFFPCSNDHSDNSSIKVYDTYNYSDVRNISHNIGHCNSSSYSLESNTLLICNSGDTTIPNGDGLLYLFENASEIYTLQTLSYTDALTIDLSSLGTKMCACFGETKEIVYATALVNSIPKIFKLRLGMGKVNFSESGYGTFIEGKQPDKYNGTAELLNVYSGVNFSTSRQGMCYYKGNLYLCIDTSGVLGSYGALTRTKLIGRVGETEGRYELVDKFEYFEYDKETGARVYREPQGCCPYLGVYMILQVVDAGMLIIPMQNRQVGKGTTGTRVTLPFKCNTLPAIQITPTSNVTDLYISEVTQEYFVVDSVSNNSGAFNWECNIT